MGDLRFCPGCGQALVHRDGCPIGAGDIPVVGDRVVLHVWGGGGYAVVRGTVEAVEDGDVEPVVILAKDDASAYSLSQVVEVRRAPHTPAPRAMRATRDRW